MKRKEKTKGIKKIGDQSTLLNNKSTTFAKN